MQATYTQRPDAVSVQIHAQGTDVFLRRNITETKDAETGQPLWTCEEVQGRLEYPVTVEEVEADFDGWYNAIASTRAPARKSETEQLAQLRADVDWIAAMVGVDLEV